MVSPEANQQTSPKQGVQSFKYRENPLTSMTAALKMK
jgi:hypothetical protein